MVAKDFLRLTFRHFIDMAFDDIETIVEPFGNLGLLQLCSEFAYPNS
jgi:hypothetical protein